MIKHVNNLAMVRFPARSVQTLSSHPPTQFPNLSTRTKYTVFEYKGASTAPAQLHPCSGTRLGGLQHGAVHQNSFSVPSTHPH